MSWIATWWKEKKQQAEQDKKNRADQIRARSERAQEEREREKAIYVLLQKGFLKQEPSRYSDTGNFARDLQSIAVPLTFGDTTLYVNDVGTNWKTKALYVEFSVFNSNKSFEWIGFNTSNDKTKRIWIDYLEIDNWKEAILTSLAEIRSKELSEVEMETKLIDEISKSIKKSLTPMP